MSYSVTPLSRLCSQLFPVTHSLICIRIVLRLLLGNSFRMIAQHVQLVNFLSAIKLQLKLSLIHYPGKHLKLILKVPRLLQMEPLPVVFRVICIPSLLLILLLIMPLLPELQIVVASSNIFRDSNLLLFAILAIISVPYILKLNSLLSQFNNGLLLMLILKSSYSPPSLINMTELDELYVFRVLFMIWSINNWPLKNIFPPNIGNYPIVVAFNTSLSLTLSVVILLLLLLMKPDLSVLI